MKKSSIGLLAIVSAVLLGGLALWCGKRWLDVAFARDAVQVIAYEVSDLYGENPGATAEEIDGVIRYLHNASVINLRIDPSGKAVDPFGTPFRAQHDQRTEASVTTVTSAGPDRRFGTGDDIRFVHEVVRDGAP